MNKEKETYNGIIDYLFHDYGTYVIDDNSNIHRLEKGSLEFIANIEDARKILKYDADSLLILNSINKATTLNLKNKNIESLAPIDDFRISDINENYIFFYTKKPQRTEGLYDRKEKEIILKSENPIGNLIIDEKIISVLNGVISLRKLQDNVLLWEQDLSEIGSYDSGLFNKKREKGEIKKIIGICNNKIIIYLTGWMVLGLNITTGEIELKISDKNHVFQNPELNSSVLENLNEFILDQDQEIVYSFQGRRYIEISLKQQEIIKVMDFENDFNTKGIYIKNIIRTEDCIMFSAMRRETWKLDNLTKKVGYTETDSVGKLNLKTNTIDWFEILDLEQAYLTSNMKTSNKKIGVIDNKHRLHIFNN